MELFFSRELKPKQLFVICDFSLLHAYLAFLHFISLVLLCLLMFYHLNFLQTPLSIAQITTIENRHQLSCRSKKSYHGCMK